MTLAEGVWCNGPFLGAMSRWDAIAGCGAMGCSIAECHCWVPWRRSLKL